MVTECVVLGSNEEIDAELDYMFPAAVLTLPVGAVVINQDAPVVLNHQQPAAAHRGRGPHRGRRVRANPLPTRVSDRVAGIESDQQALSTKMTYLEAIYKPACVKAMITEVADLGDNEKVLIRLNPPGQPIGSTWAYKEKSPPEARGTDDELYKARLCPQGFSQIAGVDYDPKNG